MQRREKNRKLANARVQFNRIRPEFEKIFGHNGREPRHRKALKTTLKELAAGRHPSYILLDLQRF